MGLDITAYKRLSKAEGYVLDGGEIKRPDGSWAYEHGENVVCFHGDERRRDDIECGLVYLYDDRVGFRAGSYSGYNNWRDELARLAGFASAEAAWGATSGPFWEMIDFSDCEGAIGSATSAKLMKDFETFQEKANAVGGWFLEKYNEWRAAFAMASDNGAVKFH